MKYEILIGTEGDAKKIELKEIEKEIKEYNNKEEILSIIKKIDKIKGRLVISPRELSYWTPIGSGLSLALNWEKSSLLFFNSFFGTEGPETFFTHEEIWEFENIHFFAVPKGLRKDIPVEKIVEYLYVNTELDLEKMWREEEEVKIDSKKKLMEEFIYFVRGFSDIEAFEKLEAKKYKEGINNEIK